MLKTPKTTQLFLLLFLAGALITPALLRVDPMFDPLRNDPRFQKLAAEPAAK